MGKLQRLASSKCERGGFVSKKKIYHRGAEDTEKKEPWVENERWVLEFSTEAEAIVYVWNNWCGDEEKNTVAADGIQTAIRQFPESSMLWTMFGELIQRIEVDEMYSQLQPDECFRKALAHDPHNSRAACDLGYWLDITDRLNDAQQAFEKSLELAPSPDALAGWLRVMAQLGFGESAREKAIEQFAAILYEPEVQEQLLENEQGIWDPIDESE